MRQNHGLQNLRFEPQTIIWGSRNSDLELKSLGSGLNKFGPTHMHAHTHISSSSPSCCTILTLPGWQDVKIQEPTLLVLVITNATAAIFTNVLIAGSAKLNGAFEGDLVSSVWSWIKWLFWVCHKISYFLLWMHLTYSLRTESLFSTSRQEECRTEYRCGRCETAANELWSYGWQQWLTAPCWVTLFHHYRMLDEARYRLSNIVSLLQNVGRS